MDKIVVKNLCFKYKENKEETLSDINLMFDNRSTAIIGQNGAGKTTFVKLLKGLLKQNSGEIIVCGKDTKDSTAAELAKYIGLVFQNPNDQIFKSKVIDEVMFGPLNIGMSSETARKNSVEALKILGLDNLIDENPYHLGLSEGKLITIASIVAMDTDIIIFDEPTIAQDFAGKEKIKRLIKELRNKGKTVLTIIHDMDFVAEVFERTIVFNKGRVILDGNTKDVYSNEEILKKAYLELPHVTQLCRQLGYNETFLTVDDFVEFYKNN